MATDGTKAYKRPLSPALSKLPGELITRDINDATRIHPNDPPHVVQHLLRKAAIKANPPKMGPGMLAEIGLRAHLIGLKKHPERYKVINQALVDLYRGIILVGRAKRILSPRAAPADLINPEKLCHIWFETEHDGSMLRTRPGPEPVDSERPAFLRNLKLTCDIMDWPQAVLDMLPNCGKETEDAVKAKCVALRNTVSKSAGAVSA